MNLTELIGLITALTALVGAVGGVIGLVLHVTGPAHQPDASHTKTPAP